MHFPHISWALIAIELVKLLKVFGLIPGLIATEGARRMYQRQRQKRAMEGWPSTSARVLNGAIRKSSWWYWTELTYTYFVDEYRSGKYVCKFRRREDAEAFVRQVREMHVQVHYDRSAPDRSVILDRDVELIAALALQ